MAMRKMGLVLVMLAVCVLPALVSARNHHHVMKPFLLEGRVYCDTCRAGFETSATTYISGAKVKVECRERKNIENVVYTAEGTTDWEGRYKIVVKEDHKDQMCDAILVSSPQSDCASADPGRDRSRVVLTRYNGIDSYSRYANSMGFMMDQPMSGCNTVLQQYQESDD